MTTTQEVSEATVWGVLRTILDPEIGLNLVDLGLIYSVACAGGDVLVVMTLTSETCPAGRWIEEGVRQALAALPGAAGVEVRVVFDPPWTPKRISAEARRELGGQR